MADANYDGQAKIYIKQGATDSVIANGGTTTIESGGKITSESGGEIETQSGTTLDFQSGTNFYFADTTAFTSDKLKYTLYSLNTYTNYISSVSTLSVSVLSPAYGLAYFSVAAGCSKCSVKLPTPSAGMYLELHFSGLQSGATLSVKGQSAGGASAITLKGSAVSSLIVNATSNPGYAKLFCYTDSVWTVVEAVGECTISSA